MPIKQLTLGLCLGIILNDPVSSRPDVIAQNVATMLLFKSTMTFVYVQSEWRENIRQRADTDLCWSSSINKIVNCLNFVIHRLFL